jgi:hypothetical protein
MLDAGEARMPAWVHARRIVIAEDGTTICRWALAENGKGPEARCFGAFSVIPYPC